MQNWNEDYTYKPQRSYYNPRRRKADRDFLQQPQGGQTLKFFLAILLLAGIFIALFL